MPWWAAIVFLLTGFFIGMMSGLSLGVGKALQQIMQLSKQQTPQMPSGLEGLFSATQAAGKEGR